MAIAAIFVLGIANFAMHRAVLASGRAILEALSDWARPRPVPPTMLVEFALLLGALLLVADGRGGWGWLYAAYTALNLAAGWAILSRRV